MRSITITKTEFGLLVSMLYHATIEYSSEASQAGLGSSEALKRREREQMRNKELEQLIREGEEILEEEKKKRRIETLVLWLAWPVILAGFIWMEVYALVTR
jgi:hypothetical protein